MSIIKKQNLKRCSFTIVLFTLVQMLYAQEKITGIIVDKKSKQTLPYANILLKDSNKGAITNEDGAFELEILPNDTLIITYISYEQAEIPASYFNKNRKLYLKPILNELSTVEITANIDFVLDLLMKARKKMRKKSLIKSKSYFTLKSKIKDRPLELLECYYNVDLTPSGFSKPNLKNGRIGLSAMEENSWYVSLSTTDIFSDYDILLRNYNKLPANPLQFSKRKIKENFEYSILLSTDEILKIEFIAKDNSPSLFNAHISIDRKNEQIVEIALFANNVKMHPFKPINKTDSLSKLNLIIAYTYRPETQYALSKVTFNYNLEYHKKESVAKIETDGVFIMYDFGKPFDLPYYSTPENLDNDYQKIVGLPYNPIFWKTNKAILPSEKQVFFKQFFSENGVLLNFDKLKEENPMLKTRIIPWSENRISLSMFEGTAPKVKIFNSYYNRAQGRPFNLSAQIYLDRNVVDGKTYYTSQTIINKNKSYYNLTTNRNTACFINLYFDQIEMARRSMMEKLHKKEWSKDEVDYIFYKTNIALKSSLFRYKKKVWHGVEEDHLQHYIELVRSSLEIDNSKLIEDE